MSTYWNWKILLSGVILSVALFLHAGENDWTLRDAYSEGNEVVTRISLNGFWEVAPETGDGLFHVEKKDLSRKEQCLKALSGTNDALPVPDFSRLNTAKREWHRFLVPGVWYDFHWGSVTAKESRLFFEKKTLGASPATLWQGHPVQDYSFAWFRRSFVVPDSFGESGETFLTFEKVNRQMWLWINGVYMGSQTVNQSVKFRPSKPLRVGERVDVVVLVSAYVEGMETSFFAGDQSKQVRKSLDYRGISGDVWLEHRTKSLLLTDMHIVTDAEKNVGIVSFRSESIPADAVLTLEITEASSGKTVAKNNSKLFFRDGTCTAEFPLGHLSRWTPDTPVLYRVNAVLREKDGTLLDKTLPVSFGVRNIRIAGRNILLNGSPVRFRIAAMSPSMPGKAAEAYIRHYKSLGYNCAEIVIRDTANCGSSKELLEIADRLGFMLIVSIPGAEQYYGKWEQKGNREEWTAFTKELVRQFRDHPSFIMWATNRNSLGYPLDQYPECFATNYYPPKGSTSDLRWNSVAKEVVSLLKEMDPTRPVFNHAGGNYGDIHSSNLYLNMLPTAEKSQWLSAWERRGTKPFFAIELGMPCDLTWFACRESILSSHNYRSEPLFNEYAAMVLGPEAFVMDSIHLPAILQNERVIYKGYGSIDSYPDMGKYHYGVLVNNSPSTQIWMSRKMSRFLFHWRAAGVSGFGPWLNQAMIFNGIRNQSPEKIVYPNWKTPGYKQQFTYGVFYDAPTPYRDVFKRAMSPELFLIAGPEDDPTDETSSYLPGSEIRKRYCWVNDSFQEKHRILELLLQDSKGEILWRKLNALSAAPGAILHRTVAFRLPDMSERTSYDLIFLADGKEKCRMTLHSIPSPRINSAPVVLFDPIGRTAGWLKENGVAFSDKDSEGVLVIGEKALSDSNFDWKLLKDAAEQGQNILVFAQEVEALKKFFHLRTYKVYPREIYSEKENPFMRNLIPSDLCAWPGKSTFCPEKPVPPYDQLPSHVWKYGNQQQVCTVTIEKPHWGNYRIWAHTGFDLNEAALMEGIHGKSRILFCQFDLAGRSMPNPAGTILLQNMLNYLENPVPAAKRILYCGTERGRRILNALKIGFVKWKEGMEIAPDDVLVAEGGVFSAKQLKIRQALGQKIEVFQLPEAWIAAVRRGADLLFIAPFDPAGLLKGFGLECTNLESPVFAYTPKKAVPGVGGGDWFWKDFYTLPRLDGTSPYSEFRYGKGKIRVLAADPFFYPDSAMNQRRERTRPKMFRLYSAVLQDMCIYSAHKTLPDQLETPNIDLTGEWLFRVDREETGFPRNWHKAIPNGTRGIRVPGAWETQGIGQYDGCAWYFRQVFIPESYRGIGLRFDAACIDDLDCVWFNGMPIGKTGKETPHYWSAARKYPIPESAIRYGEENLIAVQVFDLQGEGGIMKAPVELKCLYESKAPYLDANQSKRFDPYQYYRW